MRTASQYGSCGSKMQQRRLAVHTVRVWVCVEGAQLHGAGLSLPLRTPEPHCLPARPPNLPTIRDGPDGKVFATARALFVAPRTDRMIQDAASYILRRMIGSS